MYHPENARRTPYAPWRVWLLSLVGYVLGIQFAVAGEAYGARYNKRMWNAWWRQQNATGRLK